VPGFGYFLKNQIKVTAVGANIIEAAIIPNASFRASASTTIIMPARTSPTTRDPKRVFMKSIS
tara:strand:- start:407 stop:595 length:189 start_codon:yes stop_codon:yes gene_type:complete